MFKNFVIVAFRQIINNKVYSVINIGGLAIGLACCIAIALYIYDELSYDRFHPNKHVYRVTEVQEQAGDLYPVAVTPGVLAKELENDFNEIEQTCRVGLFWQAPVLQVDGKSVEPGRILITDNSFFSLFYFPLISGDSKTALLGMNDIVLTEKLAESLFGAGWSKANVLGREVSFNNNRVLTVVGIMADPPANTHLVFDALLPMVHEESASDNFGWNSNNYHTYISLAPGTSLSSIKAKLFRYLDKFDKEKKTTLDLQHVHDIYLHSNFAFQTDWSKHSSFAYIKIFVAVGAIVLLIAVFNFINLYTARAITRAKEVGVRKVVGAMRKQLIFQFLSETLIMTVLAVLAALFILQVSMPFLNTISGKSLSILLDNVWFAGALAISTLVLTILAGLYPAVFLSLFRPARVLKNAFDRKSGTSFRELLVVTQFFFSVVLIIGTIVIYNQLRFVQNKNLGFDKDNLIAVHLKNNMRKVAHLFKRDLLAESSIASATVTTSDMIANTSSTGGSHWEGKDADDNMLLTHMNVDPDFLTTTGMKLVTGRNFDPQIASDTVSSYIINETAAKRMGYTPTSALGKKIRFWDVEGYVIGVVKDFHFQSMTVTIEPMLLRNWPSPWVSTVLVKARGNKIADAIGAIEKTYKKYESQTAPSYRFVDDALESQYRLEQNTGKIVLIFSGLAVLVSCLGLFGLATHTAEKRTKEIGVRKALGASVTSIVNLLSAGFVKLVLVAIVLATPIGWWSMNQWLSAFAYKISIGWSVFVSAALLAITVAIIPVSIQAMRAALSNPVKALRSE